MTSFEALINCLDESVVLLDRASEVVYLNKSAEELFGKSSRDLLGRKLESLIEGDASIFGLVATAISEGRSFRGRSVSFVIGRSRNMDFSLSPFFVEGRIEGAVLSMTENMTVAEREDYSSESIDYILGSVAHEIKNPLGGIRGAAQLLGTKVPDPSCSEYIDLIVRETDRLNSILKDYLTICRRPSFGHVNVHEVMEQAISVIMSGASRTGISVRRMYDPSLPSVSGDASKLLQVFLNLIKNALESMKKGGTLEVSTALSNESVREGGKIRRWAIISISDTGRGISEANLKKIFVPFFTNKKGGTGLGLALSNKIVKDHGGHIRVKSRKGEGTTFMIHLPFERNG